MADPRRQALFAALALAELLAATNQTALAAAEPAPKLAHEKHAARKPSADPGTYATCREARAAGAAPIRRGDPGYSAKLDRDGDGVACE